MKASLRSLFSLVSSPAGSSLLVEEFQRPYAWGDIQIEALFKDQFEPFSRCHSAVASGQRQNICRRWSAATSYLGSYHRLLLKSPGSQASRDT